MSLERVFHVRARGSSVAREVVGGLTTFVTMSYVVFVHPAVLGMAGMDAGAVMTATCLAAAFATALQARDRGRHRASDRARRLRVGRPRPRRARHALVRLGDLHQPPVVIAAGGTLLTAALLVRGFRGAILVGTLATAVAAVTAGLLPYAGLLAPPPSLAPTFARLDVAAALRPDLVSVIAVLFFLGLFYTIGTLVGVAGEAGLLVGGRLPRAREAMATDAIGTMAGTVLGTSTVTAYVESAAGVAAGARTGLASLVTAACLLAALVLSPLARLAGQGVPVGGAMLYPVVAPALIVVGSFMARGVSRIDFADPPGGIAACLTIVAMPFTFSITEGIAVGSISYAVLMLAAGRAREVHGLLWLCAALFVLRYVWL